MDLMDKFLECYPFSDPTVRLVEGFAAYDGVLGDPPGTPHKGIDYVLKEGEEYRSFDVQAMHDGLAFQGVSVTWGNFVLVYHEPIDGKRYRTVYAHLDAIPDSIASHAVPGPDGKLIRNPAGTPVRAGTYVGRAGTSGLTHDIIQLHIEIHDVTHMSEDEQARRPVKLDPYGVNDRASSGKYDQPGTPLTCPLHAWTSDCPPFVLP